MHEVSELVRLAAPIASVGGVAAMVGLLRAREARWPSGSTQASSAGDTTHAVLGDKSENIPPVAIDASPTRSQPRRGLVSRSAPPLPADTRQEIRG